MSFVTKVLSYKQIGEKAENFLSKYHPSLTLPIPIEEIAESQFNIEIVPVIGVKREYDVEASIKSDFSTIFIDYDLYMKHENRTRFTIAHELGHLILHKELFESLKIETTEDLYNLSEKISDKEYSWLEWQAYSFAGQVLVPKNILFKEIEKRLGRLPKEETLETIFPLVGDLSEIFQVSGEVVVRRLQKEKIIKDNS